MKLQTKVINGTGHKSLSTIRSFRRVSLLLLPVLVICVLAIPATAHAITTISQGFLTKDKLSLGSIVSLQNNSSDQVGAANINNIDSILGVVINDGSSLLTLSSDPTTQKDQVVQVQVATSGIEQILVSDINGNVSQGDQITASPISGVGMKATSSVKVIGIAQGSLSGNGSKQTYTDKQGAKHSVMVGQVPVLVNVAYYYKQPDKTIIPPVIQNLANALAGKTVKPIPILICLAIFIVALITVVSIVFSMIRSSIVSIGRNPMAQSAVYRNLIQISALVLVILGVTVISIYLILSKF
jgi:hypothetical protein